MAFRISSPAFDNEQPIPSPYTCEGDDLSPPLQWTEPPAGTRSLALLVVDPDAPDPRAPKTTFTHWILYDLPPDSRGLDAGASGQALPRGAREGLNDFGRSVYGGPCPPIGRHRYYFKLYALDTLLSELNEPRREDLERALEGHVLAETQWMGTYQKGDD